MLLVGLPPSYTTWRGRGLRNRKGIKEHGQGIMREKISFLLPAKPAFSSSAKKKTKYTIT